MLTNTELQEAIKVAAGCLEECAPMYRERYELLRKHLDALLAEQLRRAKERPEPAPLTSPAPVVAPMQPIIVGPQWVPQQPWQPPYEITCRGAQ